MKFLWESLNKLSPNSEFSGGMTYDSIICLKGVKPTLEEVETANAELEAAEPLRQLRIQRNQLLASTDWRMLPDYQNSNQTEWQTYRQALRDITTQTPSLDGNGQLTGITWPIPPND